MTCTNPDCECYPYYGGAPGRDFAGPIPEDPESEGQLGSWFCPTCKAGIDG